IDTSVSCAVLLTPSGRPYGLEGRPQGISRGPQARRSECLSPVLLAACRRSSCETALKIRSRFSQETLKTSKRATQCGRTMQSEEIAPRPDNVVLDGRIP